MKTTKILMALLAVALLIMAGCERKVTELVEDTDGTNGQNCFTCHGEDGLLLQAKGEWANSTHASGNNVDYTNRGGTDCTKCHNHQGFLEFLETGAVSGPYDNVSAIHCFTCHAPHTRGDLSLRTETPVELIDGDDFDFGASNICANCHQSRTSPAAIVDGFRITSTHWGPHHGPQSDVLIGSNGYEFVGYDYERAGHNGVTTFAEGCITCHKGNPSQHSGYGVGGHSFNIQDEEGNNLSGVCAGCHTGVNKIDFDADEDYDGDGEIEGYQTEIAGLLDSLGVLLETAGTMSGGHPDTGVVADGGIAGATWNYILVEEEQSHGVHNFNYISGLLISSIEYVNNYLSAAPKSEGIVSTRQD